MHLTTCWIEDLHRRERQNLGGSEGCLAAVTLTLGARHPNTETEKVFGLLKYA